MDDIKKSRLKGSYTVEMALISDVWLLVIFASLFLILGTQIKVWKTAQICELSVYGSGRAVISSKRNKTKSSGYAGVLYGKWRKKRNIGRVSKGALHSVPKFELEHEGKVEKQGNKTGEFY